MAAASRKTCGECARFKVPNSGCDDAYSISQGIRLARDPACDQFYPRYERKARKQLTSTYACSCGGKLNLDYVDDAGTKWFRCERCGQQTARPERTSMLRLEKPTASGTREAPLVILNSDEKLSQADKLVLLCQSRQPILFCDQTGVVYARISQNGVNVIMPLRSQVFKAWLANLLWIYEQKAPGTQAVYSALNVLVAMANSNNSKYTLYNRVAPAEDGFWIDMADDKWRAIKVDAGGWRIVEDPPILFKRYSHQLPLSEPVPGGDPWKLLDFMNIAPDDHATRLPFLCTVITFLIPDIPHPIICTYGHQGSAKSWLFRLIRRLIDPSVVELLSLPYDQREHIQQLDHHWCAFYDNITYLPPQQSDILCRATTGGGFTKRELYSDNDDIVYDFRRCVGLNGINIPAQRGDLLDRVLLLNLLDIPKDKRKTERQLSSEFEGCKAEILGGFLDTVVKALQLYPSINPKGLFRMADFTRWGCAISVALGRTAEEFISAYEENVNSQIEEAAHASPVATVLLDLLEAQRGWDDTPTKLYRTLLNHAEGLKISTHQKGWPKAPHVLVRQLNELAPSLKALGWEISAAKSGGTRRIVINSVPSVPSDPKDVGQRDGRDAKDTTSRTFFCPPSVQEVKEKIRFVFVQGTDREWIDLAIGNGLSKEEAERLFESLKGKELFSCNMEQGIWRWVHE